ncbi:hypothetical protein [Paenibacillus sp. An7]|nr:hypothetical protein [Paenibacillus sp. An7]
MQKLKGEGNGDYVLSAPLVLSGQGGFKVKRSSQSQSRADLVISLFP